MKALDGRGDIIEGIQVPVHGDSVAKTAFVTPDGHYGYLKVPFGLANAPAVSQKVVNKMLGGMRHGFGSGVHG